MYAPVLGTIKPRPLFLSAVVLSKSQNGLATMLSILAELVPNHPEFETEGEAREE
jgi:hypothetical protein